MDIIILSCIVVILFVVFIVATYREMAHMAKTPYKYEKERGPRADMVNFLGRLFDDETASKKITLKQKDLIYKAIDRTVSDMESDGVYFPKDVKDELQRQKEELHCEYSGLPSVMAYAETKEEDIKNEVIYLHQQGISCRNIAEQMNLSKSKVDRIIQSHKADYKDEYLIGHS